jgi:glycosyltransferase involved in cell wall biosynthesis
MRAGIVIPAHNAASFVLDAIGSVRAQTLSDWHLVVVDDGSTDATPGLLAAIDDPRVTIVTQANAGVSATRNAGLAALPPADAVVFLDADDWLAPDALERLSAGLRGDAVLAYGAFAFARSSDDRIVRIKRPRIGRDALGAMLDRNHFANGGHLLIQRNALNRAGPFRTDLRFGEDYESQGHRLRLPPPGSARLRLVRENSGYINKIDSAPPRDIPLAYAPSVLSMSRPLRPVRTRGVFRQTEKDNAGHHQSPSADHEGDDRRRLATAHRRHAADRAR